MTADYTLLSPRQIVALTILGEARGEPVEGQIAVGCVIRNRVIALATSAATAWSTVCLKPQQFSCFNPDSLERPSMLSMARLLTTEDALLSPGIRQCLWIADGVMGGAVLDNTDGANHYLTANLYATDPPAWAVGVTPRATIRHHVFLRVA